MVKEIGPTILQIDISLSPFLDELDSPQPSLHNKPSGGTLCVQAE